MDTSSLEQPLHKLRDIMTNSDSKMTDFAKDVMAYTLKLFTSFTEEPPCSFAVIAMGSFGRGEATPYSDLEYRFLLEHSSEQITDYFESLAVLSYFVIGALGQTKINSLDVKELNDWFVDARKHGFQFDGITKSAGNIPNGNDNDPNRFIKTPEQLCKEYLRVWESPGENAKAGDMTAMLYFTKLVFSYGNGEQPVSAFQDEIQKIVKV